MTAELSRRGYDMIAVDRSPEMLSQAVEKLESFRPMPLLVCQDLEELDLYGTSDAAVCTLDGINYVSHGKLSGVFERIRLFLNPGGVLIFDCLAENAMRQLDGQVFLDEKEDIFCVWRSYFDEVNRACSYCMDLFVKSGSLWERDSEEHIEYVHTTDELKNALTMCGYTEIRFYADRRFDEPDGEERRFFCAARKPIETEIPADG